VKETRYQFYRRLGGPYSRSGRVRKISLPPRLDRRTVQTVASRNTGEAIQALKHEGAETMNILCNKLILKPCVHKASVLSRNVGILCYKLISKPCVHEASMLSRNVGILCYKLILKPCVHKASILSRNVGIRCYKLILKPCVHEASILSQNVGILCNKLILKTCVHEASMLSRNVGKYKANGMLACAAAKTLKL
jgi:hypothetical protein